MGALLLAGCAPPPPPAAPVAPPPPPIPLERRCEEVLPLSQRTVGELLRTLRRISPALTVTTRACNASTGWPIAYQTGESPPKSPVDFTLLHMEGDALLTLDDKDRESPTIRLCADLDVRLDEHHRVRGIGLWESSDDKAFDPKRPEASSAVLAWVELLSRTPSPCAVGLKEEPGQSVEPWFSRRLACADRPLVLVDRAGCDEPSPAPPADPPSGAQIERLLVGSHRYSFEGRPEAPPFFGMRLERPERCVYEPAPARFDACFGVYDDEKGARWYGRADVTRTGADGEKNYVDSYLTFQLLKRLEAQRKRSGAPGSGTPGGPPPAPR